MMRNITLTLSYLGTPFAGWQKTRFGKSIEEMLENALARILRETPKLQAASRTDAGVNARGQIINFFTGHPIELPLLQRALNGTLPKEIGVLAIKESPDHFHPTLDCIKKEYHYHICNGPVQLPFYRRTSWHVPQALDLEALQKGAEALLGTHDFSAFCNDRASPACRSRRPVCHLEEISLSILPNQRLCLTVIGDHFLYKMVRNIAGTLIYISRGKLRAEDLPHILESKQRAQAGITAPAHGLTLHRVYYKEDLL
jgi:tRNA pseudouridine38-40 synthase